MTTYNLHILHKMIQHHYETQEFIQPTQEEVENAMRCITNEIDDLKRLNAGLLIAIKTVKGMLKMSYRTKGIEQIEHVIDGTINTSERHIR